MYIVDEVKGNTNGTYEFTKVVSGFAITNQTANPLTFTINGITIDLDGYGVFEDSFRPFKKFTVTCSGDFQAVGKA